MKKILTTLLSICAALTVSAQQFQPKLDSVFSANTFQSIEWADINNDSLLDLVAVSADDFKKTFTIYQIDSVGFTERFAFSTSLLQGTYILSDVDSDNMIDILVSGTDQDNSKTLLYSNKGNWEFENINPKTIINAAGKSMALGDLNKDGKRELIVSGFSNKVVVEIYEQQNQQWILVSDSIKLKAISIEVFDFGNDGDNDMFLSGVNDDNEPATRYYFNVGSFLFKEGLTAHSVAGKTSVSDLNHDGFLDVLVSGLNDNGKLQTRIAINESYQFTFSDSLENISPSSVFTGDIDNDGKCDLNLFGVNAGGDSVNVVVLADETVLDFNHSNLVDQAFGDFDRDGDLDLIQVSNSNGSRLLLLENKIGNINAGPGMPFNPVAVKLFDKIFLYWVRPDDDHTPSGSLTYDVNILGTGADILTASFDQISQHRLLVAHGNTGTANYVMLTAPSIQDFQFSIQAVDNAYHYSKGVCKGGNICTALLDPITREVCRTETVTLVAASNSIWFSFRRGFLGTGSTIQYATAPMDTVFAVQPAVPGECSTVQPFLFKVIEKTLIVEDLSRAVCDGQTIHFTASENFIYNWSSAKRGFLSSQQKISFAVTGPDTIKLKLSDGIGGCNKLIRTTLLISKPEVSIEAEGVQILKGEAIQLAVKGNATTYVWSPPLSLDNASSATPIARPITTTQYTVTGTDSIGCFATDQILVVVEQTAFVPSLFTPNDDGKNDDLKVYGLDNVKRFEFSIYNREGSQVYSSQDPAQVTAVGWNGVSRGVRQPGGVYYWKVKGETSQGAKVLLNGKTSGSIVLIR